MTRQRRLRLAVLIAWTAALVGCREANAPTPDIPPPPADIAPQPPQPLPLPPDEQPCSVLLVPSILQSGVVIPEPCPPTASMEPKRYMIAWNDTPATDGEFALVVHPKQLFLRSRHNNPNPNYVYWVEQLSEGQYTQLVKFLDAYREGVFRRESGWPGYTEFGLRTPHISPERAEGMTGERGAAWERKSAAAVNSNLRRILRELNRGLSRNPRLRLDAAINRYPNIVRIAQ
jgi:hypothetical protein